MPVRWTELVFDNVKDAHGNSLRAMNLLVSVMCPASGTKDGV